MALHSGAKALGIDQASLSRRAGQQLLVASDPSVQKPSRPCTQAREAQNQNGFVCNPKSQDDGRYAEATTDLCVEPRSVQCAPRSSGSFRPESDLSCSAPASQGSHWSREVVEPPISQTPLTARVFVNRMWQPNAVRHRVLRRNLGEFRDARIKKPDASAFGSIG